MLDSRLSLFAYIQISFFFIPVSLVPFLPSHFIVQLQFHVKWWNSQCLKGSSHISPMPNKIVKYLWFLAYPFLLNFHFQLICIWLQTYLERNASLSDLEHLFWRSQCQPELVPFSHCYVQMWHSLMWALSKVFTRILFCLLLPSYHHLVCHKLGGSGFKLAFTMVYNFRTLSFCVPSLFCIMVERLRERVACSKICHFRCTAHPCSRRVKRAQWTISINSTMHLYVYTFILQHKILYFHGKPKGLCTLS